MLIDDITPTVCDIFVSESESENVNTVFSHSLSTSSFKIAVFDVKIFPPKTMSTYTVILKSVDFFYVIKRVVVSNPA